DCTTVPAREAASVRRVERRADRVSRQEPGTMEERAVPDTPMMEALQITGPDTLRQVRLPVPEPKDGEILVKTAFVGICGTDVHLLAGHSFYYDHGYLKFPFVFGHEYTGTVVASKGVEGFRPGDRVVGHCMVECHVCDNCRKGRRHLCRNLREVGLRYI